jgi:hypothetical protein
MIRERPSEASKKDRIFNHRVHFSEGIRLRYSSSKPSESKKSRLNATYIPSFHMCVLLVAFIVHESHACTCCACLRARGSSHIRTTCTYSSGIFGLSILLTHLYQSTAALSIPSSEMLTSTAAVAVAVKHSMCCYTTGADHCSSTHVTRIKVIICEKTCSRKSSSRATKPMRLF